MRILFDECVPRRLKALLPEHRCRTVAEMHWEGTKNGSLLALADAEFDLLLTADRGYEYQQKLTGRNISIVILSGTSNTFEVLAPLIPRLRACLKELKPGEVIKL
jgi:predicted nuclease of predicted toxin-antitoxin system